MPSATTSSPARTGPQGGPTAPVRAAGWTQATGLARAAGMITATGLKLAADLAAASTLLILLLLSVPAVAASATNETPTAPAQAAVLNPPAGDAAKTTAPAPEHDGGKVRLLAFGTEEMVLVRLPGGVFIWPETELTGGDKPRIILDFKGVEGWDEAYVPDGGGRIVKRIRTYLHKDEKRLRVVLDLARSPKDYAVTLSYEERVYGTEITVSAIPLRHKQ